MATHCLTAVQSGSGGSQNTGRSTLLKAKKGCSQLQIKNRKKGSNL